MFPTPFSIRRPAGPAPLGHACSIRAGPRVGLQPSSAEDRRATVGEWIPCRAAASGHRPGQGEMRGLGAIALSSRASLQPPFVTLPVTGHVRLSPKILRHRRRNRTAQEPILVRACDTEVPAQSMRAQSVHWHGFPFPFRGCTLFLRPLTPTSLRHGRRNWTAQQPIPVHACDTEAPAQSMCAQGARWHGLPLPFPRPYI